MLRLSGPWLKSIAVKSTCFLLGLVFAGSASVWAGPPPVTVQDPTAARAAAGTLGGSALGVYGNTQGLKDRASAPITDGATPMRTLDGSQIGAGQIQAPSSDAFLKAFIQPTASGDLATVLISQDLDMDGSWEHSYSVPFLVSGVCANGLVSCDAGSWMNCSYYQWITDASSNLLMQATALSQLGGCYCINSSCGSQLAMNNLGVLLKDVGGGAVGAIQKTSPNYVVTEVEVISPEITYYGQNTSAATKTMDQTISSGTVDQQQYIGNPAVMEADTATVVTNQSADPNSWYSQMGENFSQRSDPVSNMTCSNERIIQYPTQESACSTYSWAGTIHDPYLNYFINMIKFLRPVPGQLAFQGVAYNTGNFPQVTLLAPASAGASIVDVTASPAPVDLGVDWSTAGCTGVGFRKPYPSYWFNMQDANIETNPMFSTQPTLPSQMYYPNVLALVNTPTGVQLQLWAIGARDEHRQETDYCWVFKILLSAIEIRAPGISAVLYDSAGVQRNAIKIAINEIHWSNHMWRIDGVGNTLTFSTQYYSVGSAVFNFPPPECPYPDGTVCTPGGAPKCWRYDRTEAIMEACAGIDANPDCTLREETVDGVTTYMNYNPTMLAPVASCRDTALPILPPETKTDCENWWKKDRVYVCTGNQQYDFTDAKERIRVINESTNANSPTTLTPSFSDKRKDPSTGAWTSDNHSIDLVAQPAPDACEFACKTRKLEENTDVSLVGVSTSQRTSTQTSQFIYHTCPDAVTCPAGPGETIVKPCQCLSEFAEATAIMATMNAATKDMICSDGVKK